MGFYSEIEKKVEEHGLFRVLFNVQVAWMASLGVSKKGFWIRTILTILMSPIFILLGYGEFADKLVLAGSTAYDHPLSTLVATMFLMLHWAGVIFPYLFVLNILCFFSAKMWSNHFWEQVELAKAN